MNAKRFAIALIVLVTLALPLFGACSARDAERPIVVQGAMGVEIEQFASRLDHATKETVGGWTFWRGTIDGHPVVASKTLKGMENAAAATVLAAERFHPRAIVNQGTAGGHQDDLRANDIVLGVESVNVGAFKTGTRAVGEGSQFADWQPMDLLRSDGSARDALAMRRFRADDRLLAAARQSAGRYKKGRIVDGVIASSEVWNSELDRIRVMHERYGTTVEEMETAAAAQIAGLYGIPFLGVRVVSNNITNGAAYDPNSGLACQAFIFDVVRTYLAGER